MQHQPRKVQYYKTTWEIPTHANAYKPAQTRTYLGLGTFHGFFSEGDSGEMGTYALIEHKDGTCATYPLRDITFSEPTP